MTPDQIEAFPKTTMEVLESLRCFHVSAVEKARATLDTLEDDEKIARRYEKAEEKLAAAQQMVRDIDRAMDAIRDMKRHAEESGTTVTLTAGGQSVTFGAGVDPVTGEVAGPAPEPAVSVVVVLWPGDDEPHVVKVGELTRYSNLVAEYVNEAGLESDLAEFSVLTEIGLEIRDLSGTILADDYGKRLVIVPADAVEAAS